MGVDPITAPVVLGVVATGALVGLIVEYSLENEQRRRREEENRKQARRREKDREREEREERKRKEREQWEREEQEERDREFDMQLRMRRKSCECPRCTLKNRGSALKFDFPFTSEGRNSCDCPRCSIKNRGPSLQFDFPYTSMDRNSCDCPRCTLKNRGPSLQFDFPSTSMDRNSCDCPRCSLKNRVSPLELDFPFSISEVGNSCSCFMCSLKNRVPASELDFPFNSEYRNSCECSQCTLKNRVPALEYDFPSTSKDRNSCDCPRCKFNKMFDSDIVQKKNSVTVTFKAMQIREDKNQNAKNQASNTRASSSNNQGATTSNYSKNVSQQSTNSTSNASSSGSQQPQGNGNDNNNKNNKEDIIKDYGKLNDFIKKLKAAFDRCNASAELRKKILAFFDDFKKHEENFLRILKDITDQDIAIEDILPILIRLFQSDYFARDVTYGNFIAMIEIVVVYITDELSIEIAKDEGGNKKSFEEQRIDCLQKVLQRKNIVTEITDLFKKVKKEIIEDKKKHPMQSDFSSIFSKVYHYLKHRLVRGKEWSVTKYFDWVRKLLALIEELDPEYAELKNVEHSRREIEFQMYSTDYEGRFFIVVRAYGRKVCVCTFYVRERKDKKAKDGDKYVDGKKRS